MTSGGREGRGQKNAIMTATLHHIGDEHLLRAMAARSTPEFSASIRKPMSKMRLRRKSLSTGLPVCSASRREGAVDATSIQSLIECVVPG
jgi:hypothetical protein